MAKSCDPVGLEDIAGRCGSPVITVKKWTERGLAGEPFPEPDGLVSGQRWWNWPRVERWLNKVNRAHLVENWAKDTGRLPG